VTTSVEYAELYSAQKASIDMKEPDIARISMVRLLRPDSTE